MSGTGSVPRGTFPYRDLHQTVDSRPAEVSPSIQITNPQKEQRARLAGVPSASQGSPPRVSPVAKGKSDKRLFCSPIRVSDLIQATRKGRVTKLPRRRFFCFNTSLLVFINTYSVDIYCWPAAYQKNMRGIPPWRCTSRKVMGVVMPLSAATT